MKKLNKLAFGVLLFAVVGCDSNVVTPDAYGNFEAVEILVSSEANGKILRLEIEEGDILVKDQVVGFVDTAELYLTKLQTRESIRSIRAKLPNISVQINVLEEKLRNAEFEQQRFKKLVESEAATQKQYDDLAAKVELIQKEIIANKSTLTIQQKGLLSEIPIMLASIDIIDDKIENSLISSPINGTVLTKFAYEGELASLGKPMFKIADISYLICRAYISETQLSEIILGQQVILSVDNRSEKTKEYTGKITWVSSKAEFTPKVVQTKEERVNLVYAVKILVANDGYLKIGMPAEVKF